MTTCAPIENREFYLYQSMVAGNVVTYFCTIYWYSMEGSTPRSCIRWHIRWWRLQLNRGITSIFMSGTLKLSSLFTDFLPFQYSLYHYDGFVSVWRLHSMLPFIIFRDNYRFVPKTQIHSRICCWYIRYPNPLESIRFYVCVCVCVNSASKFENHRFTFND